MIRMANDGNTRGGELAPSFFEIGTTVPHRLTTNGIKMCFSPKIQQKFACATGVRTYHPLKFQAKMLKIAKLVRKFCLGSSIKITNLAAKFCVWPPIFQSWGPSWPSTFQSLFRYFQRCEWRFIPYPLRCVRSFSTCAQISIFQTHQPPYTHKL